MHCITLHILFTHLSPTASPVAYCDTERDVCLHRCGKEGGGEEEEGGEGGEGREGREGGQGEEQGRVEEEGGEGGGGQL